MWNSIAKYVTSKYGRLLCILTWLIVPITLTLISPSLTEVSGGTQEDFLPVGAESTEALKIQQEHFPSSGTPGILIYKRSNGLSETDKNLILQDSIWLRETGDKNNVIGDVISVFQNPSLSPLLISEDESTMMVFFSILNNDKVSIDVVQEEIRNIRENLVHSRTDDLQVWVTGPAGILEDAVSVFKSVDFRITVFTVIVVLALLLIIYRAPLLAIFPVLSAGLAYMSASGIAALLADRTGLAINQQATSIMVVLIFGAGTDYMLFITSRFKEQLQLGSDSISGISNTMTIIGPAIFSSATTTILAMLTLVLATLRSFQVMGPLLALGMTFAILSGLTFTPAVLSLLGRKAYWPSKIHQISNETVESNSKFFWYSVGKFVEKRYFFICVGSVSALMIMSLGILQLKPSFDLLGSLPKSAESVQGYEVLQESFETGSVSPSNVYIIAKENIIDNLGVIEVFSAEIGSIDGVARITSPSRPFGVLTPTSTIDYQKSFSTLSGSVKERLALEGLPSIGDLIESGQLETSQVGLASAFATTSSLISKSGKVAKLEVIFDADPGSLETLDKIGEIREQVRKFAFPEVDQILLGGDTAVQYDTKVANQRDVRVIGPIVLAIIFVILVILVRSIVAPLYLLGSVVLSFSASLGISVLIFTHVLGHDGIGQGVPTFMFIFLVALGIDYNIYIIARVKEESQKHGTRKGTIIAITSTGGVITSAGLILAATFTALATLPLRDLFQLGFVVSLGVLMDTFWVRGFMVPSFVMLLGKWNWWPFMREDTNNRTVIKPR